MPFFSVILPVYNVIPYLDRCIQSVLAQGFDDYELILVDDGSTDGSGELCDAYSARYNFVHVVHKENGGLSSARNAGLAEAKGQYIWWVDSDDWIEPDALHILYQASVANVPDIVKFNYFRVEERCKTQCNNSVMSEGLYDCENMDQLVQKAFFYAGKYVLSAWSHTYRRDFLEKNGLEFISERLIGSEDYLFNLEALLEAKSIQVTAEPLYNYEYRAGSLSNSYKKDLPERYTRLYLLLKNFCADRNKLEKNEGRICNFFVWHLIHGTFIPNEYHVSAQHSLKDGRNNIRRYLKNSELQYALRHCDNSRFTIKQRTQLLAMRVGFEPAFYYLFVVKPKSREGEKHET